MTDPSTRSASSPPNDRTSIEALSGVLRGPARAGKEDDSVSQAPLTIGMHGVLGRMGTRILQLLLEDPTFRLGAALDRADHPELGRDVGPLVGAGPLGVPVTSSLESTVDVLIDFSTPSATLKIAETAASLGIPLVVGTTGLETPHRDHLLSYSRTIPILVSPNMSRAVNLLMSLTAIAAKSLGTLADVEIIERHHHFKKDAPSGTALRLAEIVADAIQTRDFVHGRHGQVGERKPGEIGLHALRVGDNPGEHTVVFGLLGDTIELTHRALNRDGFARGALDAARFLADKPARLYSMADLVAI